ncbi:complement component C1q receptor isoform X2 [Pelodiscus sinensis]|uniref:complement component C1q receptor isoform X2 n=1 Tax=Pelodiscus sinensis TaxID=13735 RepID=UPI003F6A8903
MALLFFLGQTLLWGVPSWASEEAEVLCSGMACYTLHWGTHNWEDAQAKCQSNGGNLVTMKSQEEALHIQELLAKLPRREAGPEGLARFWIGLHREKGKCYQKHQLLKGFSWVSGGEETDYTGWLREPRGTCTAKRCVTLQGNSTAVLGWADGLCSASSSRALGYLCKFSFQGMCRPLALAGPGSLTYTAPFGVGSASLAAVPFGSVASVRCGPQGETPGPFLVCRGQAGGEFAWSSPGPLCASATHGCAYSNGGCQQECQALEGGSVRCACRPGYQLAGDQLSCSPVDFCRAQPCQGQCLARLGGFECRCPAGYALAADGVSCADVDECGAPQPPCPGGCVNTEGSFACTCPPGYEPEGPSGRQCRDVDECAQGAPCAQLCTNTPGSFLCACQPGYQRDGGGAACLDVDECLGEPCQERCLNLPGSYQCLCPPGWALAPNGVSCLLRPSPTSLRGPGSAAPSLRPPGEAEPAEGGGHPPGTLPASQSPAPRSDPTVRAEPGGAEQSTLQPAAVSRSAGPWEPEWASATDGPRLLLYYILGSVVVILLLMAFALGLLIYRKRKARKAKKKARSATDNYSWVPEQAGNKAVGNDYR